MAGRFRCIHCGVRFDLDPEEMEMFSEGFYSTEPDTCDDCCHNYSGVPEIDTFSDADCGL